MKKCFGSERAIALFLMFTLCLSLCSCGKSGSSTGDAVAVQSVSMLMGLDLSGANRYCGVAEPKNTEKVAKDANKDVDEVKVVVGQEVKKGDVLFTYDTESIRLSVESAELEVEQLANSITSYESQIKELEKDKKGASSKEKLSYSLQIQETALDKAEAEYNLKKKEKELSKLKKTAENTKVKAGVDGVIQSISQSDSAGGGGDYDSGSGEDTFITIMETGTYRVKGSANESNIASLSEGMPVVVYSRTDYNTTWSGTISEIDTGSAEQGGSEGDSFASEGGNEESAARYSFYVQLDNSDGMMMGQHVYILPGTRPEGEGIVLNAAFVDKEGEKAFVWAASGKDTLEKRSVTLGEYDEASDSYPILDGLTLEDYVAQCSPSLVEGKAVVKYDTESYEQEEGDSSAPGEEFEQEDGSMMTEEEYMGEGSMDFPEGSAFAQGDYVEDFADDAAIDGEG